MKAGKSGDWVKGAARLLTAVFRISPKVAFVNPRFKHQPYQDNTFFHSLSSDLRQKKGWKFQCQTTCFSMVRHQHPGPKHVRPQNRLSEAKMGEMQRRWEERFCEAIDFWHQAWSTTTAAAWTRLPTTSYVYTLYMTIYRKTGMGEIGRTFWWNYDEMLDAVELDVQMFNGNLAAWDETGCSRNANVDYVLFKMFAHVCSIYAYMHMYWLYCVIWFNLCMHFLHGISL